MTEYQRKLLEEIGYPFAEGSGGFIDELKFKAFMAGAEAAWDMAMKAERERIAMLMEDFASVIPREVVLKMFNPAPRVDGTEERGE